MPAEIAAMSASVFPEELRDRCAMLDGDFIARFRTVIRECQNSMDSIAECFKLIC